MLEKLTMAEADKMRQILKEELPWLDTTMPVHGELLIGKVSNLYKKLKEKSCHKVDALTDSKCKEVLKEIYNYLYLDEDEGTYSQDVILKYAAKDYVFDNIRDIMQNHDLEPSS